MPDEGSRRDDVYTALSQLAGVDLPEEPRTKPRAATRMGNRPLSTVLLDDLVRRARSLKR